MKKNILKKTIIILALIILIIILIFLAQKIYKKLVQKNKFENSMISFAEKNKETIFSVKK